MRFGFRLAAAVLSVAAAASAQSAPATLQGKVIDASGAAVPQASVTVIDHAGRPFQLITDRAGQFEIIEAPGIYDTTVSVPGFRVVHSGMTYAADATAVITLQPYSGGGVTVDASQPPLATSSRHVGTVLVESPVRQEANTTPLEYGVLFQGGVGVTENRGSFRFLLAGAHVGKVLTSEIGTGVLRGNFEYAGEFFPYWQSFTPTIQRISCTATTNVNTNPPVCSAPYNVGGTYTGLSVTPIILRWNFTHGQRWMPWVQGAGGLLWTNHKYPPYGDTTRADINETGPGSDTSVWNFTPQFGIGTHIFVRPRRSLDVSANAVHISSASLGDRNPGVNASVQFSVGYSWWK